MAGFSRKFCNNSPKYGSGVVADPYKRLSQTTSPANIERFSSLHLLPMVLINSRLGDKHLFRRGKPSLSINAISYVGLPLTTASSGKKAF